MKLIEHMCDLCYIEKRIEQIESQDVYDEFAGVIIYFLKRKLKQNL